MLTSYFREEIEFIRDLVARGGPDEADYAELDRVSDAVWAAFRGGHLVERDLTELRRAFGAVFSPLAMHGFAFSKPRGYPGDFEMIDRMYCGYISPDARLAKWDIYWHHHPTAQAIVNRKSYFVNLLRESLPAQARVLNLGSGPGRDVAEYCARTPRADTFIHCVDQDPEALAYALRLCSLYHGRVTFEQANIIAWRPPGRAFDLLWASGLFDYFDDRIFVRMLRRLQHALKARGRMVLGNFAPNHPGCGWMVLYDWKLQYRTPDQLLELGRQITNGTSGMWVEAEPHGINLFLNMEIG